MKPLNLLPLRYQASRLRRWGLGLGLVASALSGGAVVAVVLNAQDRQVEQLQTDRAAAQTQLKNLEQQRAQLQTMQSQAQQTQDRLQHVRALRLRAQRVDAMHQLMARQWPAQVQVQEWHVEGPSWRLQGPVTSVQGMGQLLQTLTPHGPWQQAPTLVELTALPSPALPSQAAQDAAGWRYVAQGRWSEPGLLPPSTTATATATANGNGNAEKSTAASPPPAPASTASTLPLQMLKTP
jgi:Tfp pilus assembly protein PilN